MENRKVIKIGGSNLRKKEDILRICEIVINYKTKPVIVVSAFYGITDKLVSMIEIAKSDKQKVQKILSEIGELKQDYILDLISNEDTRLYVWHKIKTLLTELNEHLNFDDKSAIENDNKRDLILSYGERMSSLIIWGSIKCLNINCNLAYPESIGLITDEIAGNASVDLKQSRENLQHGFDENSIYVVPGFYGISKSGKIRLLGRGGTDYSAAAIAYCIQASSLDIWKDVDGFMTCDPRHVSKPNQISHLSYSEAAELAYFGAGILHPRTVEPLQLLNIPARIFNIYKDHADSKPQTIIDRQISIYPRVIKSLTFENQIGILTIKGPGVGYIPGILSEITKVLSDNSINISSVITSQISINLLIKNFEIDKAKQLIDTLDIHVITNISINKDVALIAVVGNGMTTFSGIAAKVFSVIAAEGINVLLSSLGASEVVSYFIVHKHDRETAIEKLHEALFEEKNLSEYSLLQ